MLLESGRRLADQARLWSRKARSTTTREARGESGIPQRRGGDYHETDNTTERDRGVNGYPRDSMQWLLLRTRGWQREWHRQNDADDNAGSLRTPHRPCRLHHQDRQQVLPLEARHHLRLR